MAEKVGQGIYVNGIQYATMQNATETSAGLMSTSDKETLIKLSQTIEATLLADSWEGNEAPYTQNIEIEGLTEEQNGIVGLSQNLTSEEVDSALSATLLSQTQTDNILTIAAYGSKPEIDIPISIVLLG